MRYSKFCAGVILAAALARAQNFEVASVKPSGPQSIRGSDGGPGSKDPTRYTFGKADLAILLMIAYDVESFQLASKIPLDREEIDVAAALPLGTTKEQFRIMLRNLLIERFHLQAHMESREFPAYALVVAKSGPRLKPAAHPAEPVPAAWRQDGFPDVPTDRPAATANNRMMAGGYILTRFKAQQRPVSRLANMLRISAGQPVVDKTGIEGDFDFMLEFSVASTNTSAGSTAEPTGAPDLNIALREQLGLELVKQRIAFPVVVIDAVDRLPTDN
jgi:uncharacterized protein (TIGR03435 family)